MWKEFRDFALKGNLIDIAVAFVMGAAFAKVISTFTDGIVSPIIGLIFKADFNKLKLPLSPAIVGPDGKEIPGVDLLYGAFITDVINFLIVAFIMFLIVKAVNKMKTAPPVGPPPPPPADIVLLEQIRDLLKNR